MASNFNDREQKREQVQARRRFLTWAGQIAAGISLAGIGLSGANTMNALAASRSANAANQQLRPDCIPCPSYGTFCCRSCFTDSNCQPGGHTALTYYYSGGCVPPGQLCPTHVGCSRCVSSCPTNC